jgi:hypothetical protein
MITLNLFHAEIDGVKVVINSRQHVPESYLYSYKFSFALGHLICCTWLQPWGHLAHAAHASLGFSCTHSLEDCPRFCARMIGLSKETVHDFILPFLPPCLLHLTPLATGSLERSLLVFCTLGGLTGNNLSRPFFTCTNTSQVATCTCNS